jgi:hypothetical protein
MPGKIPDADMTLTSGATNNIEQEAARTSGGGRFKLWGLVVNQIMHSTRSGATSNMSVSLTNMLFPAIHHFTFSALIPSLTLLSSSSLSDDT